MWVDSRGRLYFTAGNPNWGSYDPAIYGHVYYYDPRSGFGERTDWLLQEPRALDQSQCLPDPKRCFVADDHGHIYRFDDEGPSWSYLGQVEGPPGRLWLWTLDISADGEKAYLSSSSPLEDASPLSLYEFDLTTGATRELCRFAALDGEVARFRHHFGADAWDAEGRFYLTSFTPGSGRNVILTRIDPVRLKAALGLLPAVTEVSLTRTPESQGASFGFAFARTGSTRAPQKVIYQLVATDAQGGARERHGTVVIPTGAPSVSVGLRELQSGGREEVTHGVLSVVPNGDHYVAGANRRISF